MKTLNEADKKTLESIKADILSKSFLTKELKELGVTSLQVSEVISDLKPQEPKESRVMWDDAVIFIKVIRLKPRSGQDGIEQICAITILKGNLRIRHYWDNDKRTPENRKICHIIHKTLSPAWDPDDLTYGFFENPVPVIENELENPFFNGDFNGRYLRLKGLIILPISKDPIAVADGVPEMVSRYPQLTKVEIENEEAYLAYIKHVYGPQAFVNSTNL